MSETLNRAPSEAVYDDWQVQAYKALGEKVQANEKAKAALANGFIPDQKTIRDKPLPPIRSNGKPAPNSWIGKQLAGQLFGDPDDRAGRTLKKVDGKDVDLHGQNCQKIGAMLNDGTAAAVKIIGEGKRQLRGNFFSADGYNLRTTTTRSTRPAQSCCCSPARVAARKSRVSTSATVYAKQLQAYLGELCRLRRKRGATRRHQRTEPATRRTVHAAASDQPWLRSGQDHPWLFAGRCRRRGIAARQRGEWCQIPRRRPGPPDAERRAWRGRPLHQDHAPRRGTDPRQGRANSRANAPSCRWITPRRW